MDHALPVDPELLTAQTAWVRALARSLVRDVHLADELAQEALVAALESSQEAAGGKSRGDESPGAWDEGRLRGWLRAVLRNRASSHRRKSSTREARERSVARPEACLDERLEERATEARRLVEEVMELAEPYRSTVILRFYEGLSTAEIARQLGVGEGAVRTRLSRAYTRLRRSLDARHGGDRGAWAIAFARMGTEGLGTGAIGPSAFAAAADSKASVSTGAFKASANIGGLAVGAKTILLVISSVVAATIFVLPKALDETSELGLVVSGGASRSEAQATIPVPALSGQGRLDGDSRESLVAGGDEFDARVEPAPAAPSAECVLLGRVLDAAGDPIPGAVVYVDWRFVSIDVPAAVADADGRVEVRVPGVVARRFREGEVRFKASATAEGFRQATRSVEVQGAMPDFASSYPDFRITLERGDEWLVRVVDDSGAGVRGHVVLSNVETGEETRGKLDGAGVYRVPFDAEGFYYASVAAPGVGFRCLGPFALEPGAHVDGGTVVVAETSRLSGIVRSPDGSPMPGLSVRAYPADVEGLLARGFERIPRPGDSSWSPPAPGAVEGLATCPGAAWGEVRTDETGRFRFRGLAPGQYELVTWLEGPVRHGVFPTGSSVELIDGRHILHGRVIDAEGLPVPGAEVSILVESREELTVLDASSPDGSFVFGVEPGKVSVTASALRAPSASREIDFSTEPFVAAVELVLDFQAEMGQLDLRLVDDRGRPLSGLPIEAFPRLPDAMYVSNGIPVGLRKGHPLSELPPGEYRLKLGGELFGLSDVGSSEPAYLSIERDITIRAGETTRVSLVVPRASRIEFGLRTWDPGDSPHFAEAWLETLKGGRRDLTVFSERTGGSLTTSMALVMGSGQVSEPLEGGAYTLHIEAAGFRPFSQPVVLAPGEILPVEVKLSRR